MSAAWTVGTRSIVIPIATSEDMNNTAFRRGRVLPGIEDLPAGGVQARSAGGRLSLRRGTASGRMYDSRSRRVVSGGAGLRHRDTDAESIATGIRYTGGSRGRRNNPSCDAVEALDKRPIGERRRAGEGLHVMRPGSGCRVICRRTRRPTLVRRLALGRHPRLRSAVEGLPGDLRHARHGRKGVALGDELAGPGDALSHSQSRKSFPATSSS